jgi:hypothetical protein
VSANEESDKSSTGSIARLLGVIESGALTPIGWLDIFDASAKGLSLPTSFYGNGGTKFAKRLRQRSAKIAMTEPNRIVENVA